LSRPTWFGRERCGALGQPLAAAQAAASASSLLEDRSLPWLSYHAWRLQGELARDAGDAAGALHALLRL